MKNPKLKIELLPDFADRFPDANYTIGRGADPTPGVDPKAAVTPRVSVKSRKTSRKIVETPAE